MNFNQNRTNRSRKSKFPSKRERLILIINIWLFYLLVISMMPLTSQTYSYYVDTHKISNSYSTIEDFCSDPSYSNNHINQCKEQTDQKSAENKNNEDNPQTPETETYPINTIEPIQDNNTTNTSESTVNTEAKTVIEEPVEEPEISAEMEQDNAAVSETQ
ncbi:hypothetical protein [Neobacillus niacini]|uniref:hypothetical protein n=1 Tax=Neobacillus niacini TaxID=86668 RepID=UPI003982EF86